MSDDLGTAKLNTEVDLSGLEQGLGEAETTTQGRMASMAEGLKGSLGLAFAGIGVALAGALAGAGMAAFDIASDFEQAQNDMRAQLGLTEAEAVAMTDTARAVFGNNFGDSVEDVTASLIETRQQLKGLSDEELQGATEAALSLRDAFGFEVAESTNAANVLMEKFGLTSQEAFDFITKGQQSGLNTSGDFLEAIGEYGNLMGDNGFTAEEFFSIMETGLQGGVLGVDKAADAFKEFGIRIQDGSTTTADALSTLGLEEIFTGISDGSMTVADAFPRIQEALAGIDDPVQQAQFGVALFGTQWEDMGADAMLALSTTTTSMEDMAGATDSLGIQYENLGAVWEGVSRGFLLALEPLGALMLDLANTAMPYLLAGAEQLRAGIETAIGFIGPFVQGVISTLTGLFTGEGTASLGTWGAAFEQARTLIEGVMTTVQGIVEPILAALSAFWQQHGAEIQTAAGEAWNQIGAIIGGVLEILNATVIPVLQGIGQFISDHSDDIQALLGMAWGNIQAIVEGALGFIQGIVNTVLAVIKGDWQGAWEGIKQTVTAVTDTIKTVVENMLGTVQTLWESNSDAILGAAQRAWDGIKTAITGAVKPITDGIDSLTGKIGDPLKRAIDAAKGYFDPLKRAIDAVEGAITNVIRTVQALIDKLKNLIIPPILQQQSPSPFEQSFLDLTKAMDGAAASAQFMARTALNEMTDAAEQVRALVDEIVAAQAAIRRGGADSLQTIIDAQADVTRAMERRGAVGDQLMKSEARVRDLEAERLELARAMEAESDPEKRAAAGEKLARVEAQLADEQAKLADLYRENQEAGDDYVEAVARAAFAQGELTKAQAEAAAIAEDDPIRAKEFLTLRQKQIAELLQLQKEYDASTEQGTRELIAEQIRLIQEAQAMELAQFMAGGEGELGELGLIANDGQLLDDPVMVTAAGALVAGAGLGGEGVPVDVRVSFDPLGEAWLRQFVRVEVDGAAAHAGRDALTRRSTR